MANTLVKMIQPAGGDPSGGGYNSGNEVPPGGIPPEGTKCRGDLVQKAREMFPGYRLNFVTPDRGPQWIRATSQDNTTIYKITGRCVKGYVQLDYQLLQQWGGPGSTPGG